MKMEFIFDDEKIKENGMTKEECYGMLRKYFIEYCKSKTIKEVKEGYFIGTDDDWGKFAAASFFPETDWFLDVIKEWYWYVDEGDGLGEQKEDALEAYYEVAERNNMLGGRKRRVEKSAKL